MTTKYITFVFDSDKMDKEEIKNLTLNPAMCYTAWGHIPYQRSSLEETLQRIANTCEDENTVRIALLAIQNYRECG